VALVVNEYAEPADEVGMRALHLEVVDLGAAAELPDALDARPVARGAEHTVACA
jgi:hypothetical protein